MSLVSMLQAQSRYGRSGREISLISRRAISALSDRNGGPSGAHHLGRKLEKIGHQVGLLPARYIKPYLKGHKNDFRDAEAIAEAAQRPTMRFVRVKSTEQLDLQALHRVRSQFVTQRTAVINQIRGFLLERGLSVRQERQHSDWHLSMSLESQSPQLVRLIQGLAEGWRYLDPGVALVTKEINEIAERDAHCCRLMGAPGVGKSSQAR